MKITSILAYCGEVYGNINFCSKARSVANFSRGLPIAINTGAINVLSDHSAKITKMFTCER
jgi:hypothetical protein